MTQLLELIQSLCGDSRWHPRREGAYVLFIGDDILPVTILVNKILKAYLELCSRPPEMPFRSFPLCNKSRTNQCLSNRYFVVTQEALKWEKEVWIHDSAFTGFGGRPIRMEMRGSCWSKREDECQVTDSVLGCRTSSWWIKSGLIIQQCEQIVQRLSEVVMTVFCSSISLQL